MVATFAATDFATLKSSEKYSITLVASGKEIKTSAEFSPSSASTQTPDASKLTCSIGKGKTDNVSCDLVGKNLQNVKQLKLVPTSGKSVSSVKFAPDTADTTKAVVSFSKTDYSSMTKGEKYSLTLVSDAGIDTKTTATFTP